MIDRDRMVRILVDASDLGDERAGRRYRVSKRTVARYRARLARDPELSAAYSARRAEVAELWLEEAANVRRKLLARMGELAEREDADLHKVAGAFKLVQDALMCDELLGVRLGKVPPRPDKHTSGAPSEESTDGRHPHQFNLDEGARDRELRRVDRKYQ